MIDRDSEGAFKFTQCLGIDKADMIGSDIETGSDFFESKAVIAVRESEREGQDIILDIREFNVKNTEEAIKEGRVIKSNHSHSETSFGLVQVGGTYTGFSKKEARVLGV